MSLLSVVYQCDPANCSPDNVHGYWPRFLTDPDGAMADALANTRRMGCLGTLFWDQGGPVNWYVATPWLSTRPQAFDDKWFAAFRDAGLQIGGTIRPRLRLKDKPVYTADHYGALAERIDYARTRWGWTLFYCDDVVKTQHNNDPGEYLDPAVYRQLAEDYPDCLFFPERVRADHEGLANVRPLQFFPREPQNATPPLIRIEMDYKPTATDFYTVASAFKGGAWGLVSATNPDSAGAPNMANRMLCWADRVKQGK